MKFCKKNTIEENRNGTITTINYVSYEDVKAFHGEKFANQWIEFIKSKKSFLNNGKTCYYYADYKDVAYSTDLYLIE